MEATAAMPDQRRRWGRRKSLGVERKFYAYSLSSLARNKYFICRDVHEQI
jgi:hypothetical protein